ncbi:MAG: RNA polymerase factor sigma-54 [Bacillota bacterium]
MARREAAFRGRILSLGRPAAAHCRRPFQGATMDLGPKLVQQQTQKLIMTPELRQAITVLQLSATELSEYLTEQVLANPVLEVRDEAATPASQAPEDGGPRESEREGERFDLDWQSYFQDRSDLGFTPTAERDPDAGAHPAESRLTEAPTLEQHLDLQLHLCPLTAAERRVGEYFIGMLDEGGYLRTSLEEAAEVLGVPLDDVVRVHQVFTSFDPPGVGARDLSECLRLQLEAMPPDKTGAAVRDLARRIIDGHLEELGSGRLARLSAALAAPAKQVQQAADFIRSLDPRPGGRFADPNDIRYIVPDVIIERVEGDYVVIVNDTAVPRLGISRYYRQLLERGVGTVDGEQLGEARAYIEGRLNSALWLIRAIEQRRRTLYRVTETVVRLQRDFLDHGLRHLRPMSLRHVAEIIGMHESTVSRATSNKYVQTPQGTFELKYFFTSGVAAVGETAGISSESVKMHIQDLVAGEDPGRPLSDDALTKLLEKKGIAISRRTVAKYRDEMGVPSSSRRRRL